MFAGWSDVILFNDPDLKLIIESDARSTGVQLKSAAKLSTVIGLITKLADCRMTFKS